MTRRAGAALRYCAGDASGAGGRAEKYCTRVAKLELEGETRGHGGAGDFLEIVELAVEEVVSANAAALSIDGTVAAGRAQRAEKYVLDHFRGRLGPALVFVSAHGLAVGTVDDAIFAIEMGGH